MRRSGRTTAPPAAREPSIERTKEYEEFMANLAEYHQKRGTVLDPEPRIGNKHVDLFRLYRRITAEGGYDAVSEVKLAWRKISTDFVPISSQQIAHSFQLKTVYYKNLAAYEISTFHKREPPPKEILEDVTAKGGDLLNRTLENFKPRAMQDSGRGDDEDGDGEGDGESKPEEPETLISARKQRIARQVQPRVIFDPSPIPSRQTRAVSRNTHSPTPAVAAAMNQTHQSIPLNLGSSSGLPAQQSTTVLASYNPEPPVGVNLEVVATPASDPERFKALSTSQVPRESMPGVPQIKGLMLPGTGFPGPNIYSRIQLALSSGIQDEVQYALHHLVKISHERGDKYRFAAFPGLAEAVLDAVLQVTELFYGKPPNVCFSGAEQDDLLGGQGEANAGTFAFNGLFGTSDLLGRLENLAVSEPDDGLCTSSFAQKAQFVTEASLVLRNMSLRPDNAAFLATIPLAWDVLALMMTLPPRSFITEARLYCIETAEQMTGFAAPTPDRELRVYDALLKVLADSDDRGAIVCALRALGRSSSHLPTPTRLPSVSNDVLVRLVDWLLVEDSVLREASLGVLYIITAEPEGVLALTQAVGLDGLIGRVMPLVMSGAVYTEILPEQKEIEPPRNETPPPLPPFVAERIHSIPDLKERSSEWLRASFEEDAGADVTQIKLWNAYSEAFSAAGKIMNAKEFIANVSQVFPGAAAQVSGTRYAIKGIRARTVPAGPNGLPYMPCLWKDASSGIKCEFMGETGSEFWRHVVSTHLAPLKGTRAGYTCCWGDCGRWFENGRAISSHIQTHWPDDARPKKVEQSTDKRKGAQRVESGRIYWNTPVDERATATGVPVAAILVLRNLARQIPRLENRAEFFEQLAVPEDLLERMARDESEPERGTRPNVRTKGDVEYGSDDESGPTLNFLPSENVSTPGRRVKSRLVARAFGLYRDQIYYAMAYNLVLREHLGSLANLIADACGGVW